MSYEINESRTLELSRYAEDPERLQFAVVVREEIEKCRVDRVGDYKPPRHKNVLMGLLHPIDYSDSDEAEAYRAKWFEFLTELDVIRAAGERLRMGPSQFLDMCIKRLMPPNWETLFWMRAYLDATAGDDESSLQKQERELQVVRLARSEQARKGAAARIAKDPKQEEKKMVHECWQEWQRHPARYSGKAQFARDMLAKYENLKSQTVIERWCRFWERGRT